MIVNRLQGALSARVIRIFLVSRERKRIENARGTVPFCDVVSEGDKKWRKMEDPETGDEARITEPAVVFPGRRFERFLCSEAQNV